MILLFSLFLLFLLLFLVVAFEYDSLFHIDHFFQNLFPYQYSPLAQSILTSITNLGGVIAIFCFGSCALLILLFQKKLCDLLWPVFFLVGGNAWIHFLLKPLVARPRQEGMILPEDDFSFPSGHTFSSLLLVFLIWYHFLREKSPSSQWTYGSLLGIYFFGVASSRIWLHEHYFTDVFGSILFAFSWGSFTLLLLEVMKPSCEKIQQRFLKFFQK